MDKLVATAKAISDIHPASWGMWVGLVIIIIGVFSPDVLKHIGKGELADLGICLLPIGAIVIAVSMYIGTINVQADINDKMANFKEHMLLPYVQHHRQTIQISGYSCGKENGKNVYNLTSKSRINVTAYYKDSIGQIQAVSGAMVVYQKGNDKITLDATKISRRLSDDLGAGFYEPILTIPIGTDFTCGKVTGAVQK